MANTNPHDALFKATFSPGTLEPRVAESLPEHKRRIIMNTAERLRNQGRLQGYPTGCADGRVAALLRLLESRFGPLPESTRARIAAADTDTFDRCLDRLLSAPDIDTLFD